MQKDRQDNPKAPDTNAELNEAQLDSATGGAGSPSTGAGAGKPTFKPFTITRKIDKSSPIF